MAAEALSELQECVQDAEAILAASPHDEEAQQVMRNDAHLCLKLRALTTMRFGAYRDAHVLTVSAYTAWCSTCL